MRPYPTDGVTVRMRMVGGVISSKMEESAHVGASVDHTRHALEGGVDANQSEPLNDRNNSGPDTKPVTYCPDHVNGSLTQTDSSSLRVDGQPCQPSPEERARMEEEVKLNNDEKNMVFDVICSQAPEKIQRMMQVRIGTGKDGAGVQVKLSELELKRLIQWLTEYRPFAEPKESLTEPTEDTPLSVEEENNCVTHGLPVFPSAQVQPQQTSTACPAPSKCKKMVQRTNSVLGSGTYGEVRVVRHKNQCYAAKELKLQDLHYIDNLYREAANLALLSHNNIVTFCGIGIYEGDKDAFLILTELLATSLHRYLMEEPVVSLKNQISILFHILNGLEYMHECPSIIHGDLKTKNILLSKEGIAKIADLGSSHLAYDNIGCRYVCGTPSYMAPEMGRREYTEKMDVFAYGHLSLVTLTRWEIKLGEFRKPEGSGEAEVSKRSEMFAQLHGTTFSLISGFIPLIKACLCDEPNRRPTLTVLKAQMLNLRLPRETPSVTVDTAVRNEV